MKTPNLSPQFADELGAQAAWRLFNVARYDDAEAEIIAHFLVSLHNNRFAAPDLYLLCRNIDDEQFRDVITVMGWFRDAPGRCDLQEIFGNGRERVMADLISRTGLNVQPTH
jgi:hypothetical protein